jgi:hypothetical protein
LVPSHDKGGHRDNPAYFVAPKQLSRESSKHVRGSCATSHRPRRHKARSQELRNRWIQSLGVGIGKKARRTVQLMMNVNLVVRRSLQHFSIAGSSHPNQDAITRATLREMRTIPMQTLSALRWKWQKTRRSTRRYTNISKCESGRVIEQPNLRRRAFVEGAISPAELRHAEIASLLPGRPRQRKIDVVSHSCTAALEL